MKLLVTVDVEGRRRSSASTADRYEPVSVLDSVLSDLGIETTLFVTPDVVENRPRAVREWRRAGHTVGLHVHPSRMSGGSDWLTDYDGDAIDRFVTRGCETFEAHLGFVPTHFRAGRWEYSETLLAVLGDHGFDRDASLVPDRPRDPYERHGVEELPLTTYANPLVRPLLRFWDAESIPLYADWFLPRTPLIPGFYAVTYRLLHSSRPYLMTAFHDYDLLAHRNRIRGYLSWLSERTTPLGIGSYER